MATKNYMINDKWLDLDKQNIVELQSVDGELDSLKVNGSEIVTPSGKITITENGTDIDIAQYALADVNVEGGGGSSDFSTAEVTLANDCGGQPLIFPVVTNNGLDHIEISEAGMYVIPLYNGHYLMKDRQTLAQIEEVSGNIEEIGSGRDAYFDITGDCVITPWNE